MLLQNLNRLLKGKRHARRMVPLKLPHGTYGKDDPLKFCKWVTPLEDVKLSVGTCIRSRKAIKVNILYLHEVLRYHKTAARFHIVGVDLKLQLLLYAAKSGKSLNSL